MRDPLLQPVVGGGLRAEELAGLRSPLAGAARQPDQPVEDAPVGGARAAGLEAGLVDDQEELQLGPQGVVDALQGRIVLYGGRRGRGRCRVYAASLQ